MSLELNEIHPGLLDLTTSDLLRLYEQMILLRKFELAAQKCYKNGEMPGFIHLYIGQEATAVGVCAHLSHQDWITSTHRGHGHALAKGVEANQLLAELFGKATGVCGGRGGSMHLYAPQVGLLGTNGFVGGGIPSAVGLGLSCQVKGTDNISVAFFGDGAVNHGSFHESLNFAGALNAPVLFICENNLYATATPLAMTTRNTEVAEKADAYGIPGVAVDGNDILAVWEVTRKAVERAREGLGPTLIESKTYRFVGHHEGDPLVGTYRTKEEMDLWLERCPIKRFRARLIEQGIATDSELDAVDERVDDNMREVVEFARSSPFPVPETAINHCWADPINPPEAFINSTAEQTRTVSWLEAVRDGIAEEMRRDSNIVYMGEGIGERGGSFAHTKGLWQEFGAQHLIDTPISELAFTGAGVGLAANGCRAVADLMITDFLFDAASQIIHQAGKLRYMSNGQISVPLIVRSMNGTIKSTGPHHSGNYYPSFAHCPGLIIAVPSTPADAKALFKTALRAQDPVIFFEHKALLSTKGPVPVEESYLPFGKAAVRREGKDLTIISCSLMIHRCLEAAEKLAEEGIDCEVIDLRTIVPLDIDCIATSVSKTGRVLIVDEAFSMCGIGAEIASVVMETVFDSLDAPVGRLHIAPVASPFSPPLEGYVLPDVIKVTDAARSLVKDGQVPQQMRPVTGCVEDGDQELRAVTDSVSARVSTSLDKPADNIASSASQDFIRMPNQDLTVAEATVVRWLKEPGDQVKEGEIVAEVETDKATVDVESPFTGRLAEILTPAGATVAMSQRMAALQRD